MNQTKIINAAAIGMAVLAAWYVLRKPAQAAPLATQSAAGNLFATLDKQLAEISFANNAAIYGTTLANRGLSLEATL